MKELFPDNAFHPMPAEHAIWTMFPGITPKDFPEIEVLERGCRTVASSAPCRWPATGKKTSTCPRMRKNPKNRGEKAYCLARNIVAYATGMELPKPKLTQQHIVAKGIEAGVTRSHFKAAQMQV